MRGRTTTASPLLVAAILSVGSGAVAGPSRERAIEQIPELMDRILESQEQIRQRESELAPRLESYDRKLERARGVVEKASSEDEATEALVDYIEAYSARLDEQHAGLSSIEAVVVRMRADARQLADVARAAGGTERATPADRRSFAQDHFQGLAAATGELAERLDRRAEAASAGAVLHASWSSQGAVDVPVPELGPEGALEFARQVEGLYARVQARSNQLRAERQSVRRLLDVLIERQLARRLDDLFTGDDAGGLGALLAGGGASEGWEDLGSLVSRTLGLPSTAAGATARETASLEQLDYFASGGHRE